MTRMTRMTRMTKLFAATAAIATFSISSMAYAGIPTGSQVSDMMVTDSNGKTHKLSDFKGKNIVLEWTNDGCPYVKKHYATNNMQNLQKSATADGETVWLSVISSAPGTQGYVSGEEANAIVEKFDAAPTAVILDPEGVKGKAFGAQTTPHMYIIDANQTLVYQGAIDDNRSAKHDTVKGAKNYVAAALAEIKAGKPVSVTETKAYGCSVKYKS